MRNFKVFGVQIEWKWNEIIIIVHLCLQEEGEKGKKIKDIRDHYRGTQ
jgi:hypothetical protein